MTDLEKRVAGLEKSEQSLNKALFEVQYLLNQLITEATMIRERLKAFQVTSLN